MSSCPNCQKQIEIKEEHYGTLYRCAYCKTEFFVDFSGQPENSKEAPPVEENPIEVQHPEQQAMANSFLESSATPELTEIPSVVPMTASTSEYLQPDVASVGATGLDFFSSPVPPTENQTSYSEQQIPQPMNTIQTEPVLNENFGNQGATFLNEISDFGNEVHTHTGILNLNIIIDDIDLPEQKNLLLEQLEDSRFGLDMDEVKDKLKYGKIEIHNFPVSKAIVLIHRLQGLSLKISWRENVITQ